MKQIYCLVEETLDNLLCRVTAENIEAAHYAFADAGYFLKNFMRLNAKAREKFAIPEGFEYLLNARPIRHSVRNDKGEIIGYKAGVEGDDERTGHVYYYYICRADDYGRLPFEPQAIRQNMFDSNLFRVACFKGVIEIDDEYESDAMVITPELLKGV